MWARGKRSAPCPSFAARPQDEFLPTTIEVHWLSIINSFVLVVLLTVFLSIILLRVLKNDFTRCVLVSVRIAWKPAAPCRAAR